MVKTIGDAVMATFPTPDRALAAALRMREAMARHQCRARQRGPAAQDRHPRGAVPRGHAQRPPGLFRPDREHGRARAGACLLPRDHRHQPVVDDTNPSKSSKTRACSRRCSTRRYGASPRRPWCTRFPDCHRWFRSDIGLVERSMVLCRDRAFADVPDARTFDEPTFDEDSRSRRGRQAGPARSGQDLSGLLGPVSPRLARARVAIDRGRAI